MLTSEKPEFFSVEKEDVYETIPGTNGQSFRSIPERKLLRRMDTGSILSVVSHRYTKIDHEEIFDATVDALDNYLKDDYHISTTFDNNGARMKMTVHLPDELGISLAMDDLVNPKINAYNSYDLSMLFGMNISAFREVCTNGLMAQKKLYGISSRHMGQKVLDWLTMYNVHTMLDKFNTDIVPIWNAAINTDITDEQADKVFTTETEKGNFTNIIVDAAINIWGERIDNPAPSEQQSNAWVLYNAFTNAISHPENKERHSIEREIQLQGNADKLLRQLVRIT